MSKNSKSRLSAKSQLRQAHEAIEQHYAPIATWRGPKLTSKWQETFHKLLGQWVAVIRNAPTLHKKVNEEHRSAMALGYYCGIHPRTILPFAKETDLFLAWKAYGVSREMLSLREASFIVGSVRVTTEFLIEGRKETKLPPGWERLLQQYRERSERERPPDEWSRPLPKGRIAEALGTSVHNLNIMERNGTYELRHLSRTSHLIRLDRLPEGQKKRLQ